MIRRAHTHPGGKVCYVVGSHGRNRLERSGLFRIGPRGEFAAAYMPYTGSWYAFDPETGREIAQFSREFYESAIAGYRCADLTADPDCVPV